MKVVFTPAVRYWSGRSDAYVYGPSPNRQYSIARTYRYPTITEHNTQLGKIMKNLSSCWSNAHADYKADLVEYTTRYLAYVQQTGEMPYPCHSAFGWFVSMFWKWYDSDPETVDLEVVTCADVITLNADTKSITTAVTAEFLPNIPTHTDLDNLIVVA